MEPGSSRLLVTVTDGRGRPVADAGLARWLSRLAPGKVRGEVAIALVSDAHIRKLNREFRGKDTPTDVLSFPADSDSGFDEPRTASRDPSTGSGSPRASSRGEPRHVGDLVIATGVARRQAREQGHAYATELRVLALHGFLHLLGYDHDHRDDGGRMARAEARLRRRGGLREGLIARAGQRPRPAPASAKRVAVGPHSHK